MDHEESMVKVIQEWNGYRPPIKLLTKGFRRWITEQEIHQKDLLKKKPKLARKQLESTTANNNFQINWIERLLQKGIADGRKETLRLILGPYLIKRKNYNDAAAILEDWLDKCNSVKTLDRDFNPNQRIRSALKNTRGFMKLESLKSKYPWLYDAVVM